MTIPSKKLELQVADDRRGGKWNPWALFPDMIRNEALGNKQNSLPLAMRTAAAVDVDTFIL